MKRLLTILAIAGAVSLGGCNLFHHKAVAPAAKTQDKVVVQKDAGLTVQERLTLLEGRVQAVEARNARVDARARAALAKARPVAVGN